MGLSLAPETLPTAPAVEIGWRLSKPHWGMGYASEAANAALRFAFNAIGLSEIVAFTATSNVRSRKVMPNASRGK